MSDPSVARFQPSMSAASAAAFDKGSFRDPGGRVLERGDRISATGRTMFGFDRS